MVLPLPSKAWVYNVDPFLVTALLPEVLTVPAFKPPLSLPFVSTFAPVPAKSDWVTFGFLICSFASSNFLLNTDEVRISMAFTK